MKQDALIKNVYVLRLVYLYKTAAEDLEFIQQRRRDLIYRLL